MQSFSDVLNLVKDYFLEKVRSNELTETAYRCWIKNIEPDRFENNTAYLVVSSPFYRGILIDQYMTQLKEAFEAVLGFPVSVEISCSDAGTQAPQPQPAVPPHIPPEPAAEQAPPKPQVFSGGSTSDLSFWDKKMQESGVAGDYAYTFDTFIVGSKNKFAYSACQSITDPKNFQNKQYNPLFIYGPSGLGKTHLLMAIKNELQQKAPQLNVIYTSCETFVNELIIAIKKQNTDEFHTKYRSLADFFLIDDIQFLSGKESSQEEFFHTFNELYQGGKQIVITSDRPPKDINILEDRLKTRFEWGLLADIGAPDFETRVAIIQRKAELLHIELPDDIINFIATKLKTNIRQLEGAVNKIKMHKLYTGSEPSLSIAQTVINEILNDNQPMPITIERIIDEVAQTYRVNPADIRSNKKNAPISQARQIAIYIVREITQATMKEIGQEFGGRDHTTIVYTLKKVENLIKTNAHDRGIIEDIIKNIRDK
ncbi:MAG TPA: chromosomal replication initiator protein DnaA [Candidatus Merdivicinus faecavium]|nr:chromosomal replication initiator protein DnaA [Candidatus Merdivicinus faecavium]